jgi:transglutaminase-like putative cysteine protease/predicted Zn-dependent protease
VVVLVWLIAPLAAATDPWVDTPAFSVPPEELLAAADATEPDTDAHAVELLEEHTVTFDDDGRQTWSFRRVYQIRHPRAVSGWGYTEAEWAPWYQLRPVLEARVIRQDGTVFSLSPDAISETGAGGATSTTFIDARRLRAPLPGVEVGAVVEERITWSDERPFFEAGRLAWWPLVSAHPVSNLVVDVRAPTSIPLDWTVRGPHELAPIRIRERGVHGVRITREDLPALAEPEPFSPRNSEPWPTLEVSTARSWSQVGRTYAALMEPLITAEGLDALVAEVRAAPDRASRIDLAGQIARDRVRYTAVAFGRNAIVPHTPAVAVERGYGDCKDKSTLFVALLRAVGIPAHLALVRSTPGLDVDDLPGLDQFDHAIAYVPGRRGAALRWFDPSAPAVGVRETPTVLQGRSALVIDGGQSALRTIPIAPPRANRLALAREWHLQPDGVARVEVRVEADGLPATLIREPLADQGPRAPGLLAAHYGRLLEGRGEPGMLEGVRPPDTRLAGEVTVQGSRLAETTGSAGVVRLDIEELSLLLPRPLGERRTPLAPPPHRISIVDTVHLPPGYRAASTPETGEWTFGALTVTVEHSPVADGFRITHTLDTGTGIVPVDALDSLQERVESWAGRYATVVLEHVAEPAAHNGDLAAAFAAARGLISDHPGDAHLLAQHAALLLTADLMGEAETVARRAVTLAPEAPLPWRTLGFIRMHDRWGRQHGPGWDRAGSISAFEQALGHDPSDRSALRNLARALRTGPDGWWSDDPEALDNAAAVLATLHGMGDDARLELAELELHRGRLDRATAALDGVPPSPRSDLLTTVLHALSGDLATALRHADSSPDRAATLRNAGGFALETRSYPAAAALLGAIDPTRAAPGALATARTRDEVELQPWDPVSVGWLAYVDAALERSPDKALHHPAVRSEVLGPRRVLLGTPTPLATRLDLLLARGLAESEVEAAPTGWRVTLAGEQALYVARMPSGLQLRAVGGQPGELATHALSLDAAGNRRGATAWARWAAAELAHPELTDHLDPSVPSDRRLLAGAALVDRDPARACDLLDVATAGPETAGWVSALRYACLDTLDRPAEALEALDAAPPRLKDGLRPRALIALGRLEEALSAIPAMSAQVAYPSLVHGEVLWRLGREADALDVATTALDRDPRDPVLLNELAWMRLFVEPGSPGITDLALSAVAGDRNTPRLHTLAVALAAEGRLHEARRAMAIANEASGGDLDEEWLLVLGVIATKVGETQIAEHLFDRLTPSGSPTDSARLAARLRERLP